MCGSIARSSPAHSFASSCTHARTHAYTQVRTRPLTLALAYALTECLSLCQTYFGVDVNAITDHVRQKALKTMIETYGQTPQQLFNFPHSPRPQRKPQTTVTQPSELPSLTSMNALKYLETDPAFGGIFSGRLTTSISSDTGTIASSNTGTISGKKRTFAANDCNSSSTPSYFSITQRLRIGVFIDVNKKENNTMPETILADVSIHNCHACFLHFRASITREHCGGSKMGSLCGLPCLRSPSCGIHSNSQLVSTVAHLSKQ